eukprot:COSAG04_NODE_312_length_17133_cov_31.976928_2_plen_596_part_00
MTQGASWDVELIEDIGAAIATEARACGIDTALSPVLNLWVDSRFGRLQEGFSENPTLTAAFAIAATKGLQGQQPPGTWEYFARDKVVSLAKHYAAYGAALGGLNGAPAELSERTLRDVYLKPWRAFARAGGKAAMASHNTVLNRPMHANDYVTNTILRQEFGFGDGVIVSDCNDVPALVDFRVAANLSHAAASGIAGGVDMDLQCALAKNTTAYTHLTEAMAEGLVSLEKVRTAARRVLSAKFALGLFEAPFVDPAGAAKALNTPEHRALALRAAETGVVLLANKRSLLPLGPDVKRIAVIGANGGCEPAAGMVCDGRKNLLGSYTQWIHYPAVNHSVVPVTTVAEALEAACPDKQIEWARGAAIQANPSAQAAAAEREAALALAARADVVVAVLGDDLKSASEWGDRDSLDLPGDQMPLLTALAATGKPIVLVLVTGRTATFGDNSVLDNVTAVLSAFRPGQEGGVAIANLLTGKANPSGKLAQVRQRCFLDVQRPFEACHFSTRLRVECFLGRACRLICKVPMSQNWVRNAGQSMSGASPWLQWRVGKWVANRRSPTDPDGYTPPLANDVTRSATFSHRSIGAVSQPRVRPLQ